MIFKHCVVCWWLTLSLMALPYPGQAQDQQPDKPLPELSDFLKGVRAHLRSDQLLLSQYTYTEKQTLRQLDSKGNVKSTKEQVHEVYPSLEEDLTYRRLISKNGRPVSPNEIDKHDREHDKKVKNWAQKLAREGTDERAHRLAKETEERRKEEEIIDELFRIYQITMAGREHLDGHTCILLTFDPLTTYKPRTKEGKVLAKVAGRAWICEQDYELVRIEIKLIDTVSFGMGLLARLNKGATATLQRRKLNDEIWLPAEARFAGSARLLILKGMRIEAASEYSDYMKFTVETQVKYRRF